MKLYILYIKLYTHIFNWIRFRVGKKIPRKTDHKSLDIKVQGYPLHVKKLIKI